MALKKKFTEDEKYGLTGEEYKAALKHLRQHKTAGALDDINAAKLFELFILGDTLAKLAQAFPQFSFGQIALTAALRFWYKERDRLSHTLQDRVRAKVVKSVLDQVDFLTAMMAVANTEHLEAMMRYIQDPLNNPKPAMRVSSIKDYKDISEALYKIVAGATGTGTGKTAIKSPMFDALTAPQLKLKKEEEEEQGGEFDITALAADAPSTSGKE